VGSEKLEKGALMGGPWEDFKAPESTSADGPWSDFKPPATGVTRTSLLASMDKNAKDMGYKDLADQSAKVGQGVMGGQISQTAGPAIKMIGRILGRAAPTAEGAIAGGETAAIPATEAAESAPAAMESAGTQVSRAGPIRNLPRPGSPLFEGGPAASPSSATAVAAQDAPGVGKATMDAFYQSLKESQGKALPANIQKGLEVVSNKFPMLKAAMGGGGTVAGWEAVKFAMRHPQMAGALAAASMSTTPAASAIASGASGLSAGEGKPDQWAMSGFQNLVTHNPNGALSDEKTIERAFASPKVRQLLMEASDLNPGSKSMQNVYNQIQSELKGTQ
jgi:hypothetical protein